MCVYGRWPLARGRIYHSCWHYLMPVLLLTRSSSYWYVQATSIGSLRHLAPGDSAIDQYVRRQVVVVPVIHEYIYDYDLCSCMHARDITIHRRGGPAGGPCTPCASARNWTCMVDGKTPVRNSRQVSLVSSAAYILHHFIYLCWWYICCSFRFKLRDAFDSF